jgi:serine/threonine protein kinase
VYGNQASGEDMSRFCPACHRSDALNPQAITAERASCPRDFFQIVEREVQDPIAGIFGGKYQTTTCILPGEKHAIFKVIETASSAEFLISVFKAKTVDTKRLIKFVDQWAGIRHRNVLPVTKSGASPDGTYLYVISESPHGKPLTAILDEQGTLPASKAIQYFLQLCDGLEQVNKIGLVHGNLMPAHLYHKEDSDTAEHIIISCHAALARFVDPPPDAVASSEIESELSPLYIGMEFLKPGVQADAATDVYSLGTVMYVMLTGLPPFAGKTFESIKQSHLQEQPLSLRGAAPDIEIPGMFDKIVLRTLKKDKIDRYPDADSVKKDLLIAAEKSRIYLPAYANASYTATAYTGDTGAFQKQPPRAADFIQGNTSSPQAPAQPGNTGPVDLGKDLELDPESRLELEDKVQGLRSHVFLVTAIAVVVIVGLGALLLYEGPPEDRAPAWKKLSWTFAMSGGDGALTSKSLEKAKDEFNNALKIADEIQDGGDRKAKSLRKLRIVHEEMHDKKAAESYREQVIKLVKERLQLDEAPIK